MGECGCGHLGASGDLVRFPAPDGGTYVLEQYKGCRDCGLSAGITIHHWTKEAAELWESMGIDEPKWFEVGQGCREFASWIISAEELREALVKGTEYPVIDGIDLDVSIEEVFSEKWFDLLWPSPPDAQPEAEESKGVTYEGLQALVEKYVGSPLIEMTSLPRALDALAVDVFAGRIHIPEKDRKVLVHQLAYCIDHGQFDVSKKESS